MTYRIGLDIGTTATKACAFDASGKLLKLVERGYDLLHPAPGAATQDPEAVFAAAASALAELIRETKGQAESIGLSCPMHSVILLNEDFSPIMHLITWADTRGVAVMNQFTEAERYDLHALTGTPVHPMSPLVTLRWLAQHDPDTFSRAAYISDLKSTLVHRWTTDGLVVDEQLASATGMMNLKTSRWATEATRMISHDLPKLPTIKPANTLLSWRPAIAARLGTTDVDLFLGGSDGVLANLGAGILSSGNVAMSVGTSGAVRTTHTSANVTPDQGLFNYKMKEGLYVIGGATNNGGKVLEYWQQLLVAHFPDVGAFIAAAMRVNPIDCPSFTPYLNGERAPIWDATATATLRGLRGFHTPAHIARAVLEGVSDNIVAILRQLEAVTGPANRILASGGFTKSPEWLAMIAEKSGRSIEAGDHAQAVAYGATLVGNL